MVNHTRHGRKNYVRMSAARYDRITLQSLKNGLQSLGFSASLHKYMVRGTETYVWVSGALLYIEFNGKTLIEVPMILKGWSPESGFFCQYIRTYHGKRLRNLRVGGWSFFVVEFNGQTLIETLMLDLH